MLLFVNMRVTFSFVCSRIDRTTQSPHQSERLLTSSSFPYRTSSSVPFPSSQLKAMLGRSTSQSSSSSTTTTSSTSSENNMLQVLKLISASFLMALLFISWEDLSMYHPMRQNLESYHWGLSTVRGMAFGQAQRERLDDLVEPQISQTIPSYNEVLLLHRTERIPRWQSDITEQDVKDACSTIQKSILYLQECKALAKDYDWEGLKDAVRHPLLHEQLEQACGVLKNADSFLSIDERKEIGFEWASCAWRHCGALADAQEALDQLDHLVGILEPFECLFCLDIVERSLYDILAVTKPYQDSSIVTPVYKPLQRMSDIGDNGIDQFDSEYLEALDFIKRTSAD